MESVGSEISVESDEEVGISHDKKSIGSLSSFGQEFNIAFQFFPGALKQAENATRLCFLSIHTGKSTAMDFSTHGTNLVGRFSTEYTVDDFNGKLEPKLTVALFGGNFGRTGLESIVWSGDLCGHQSHRAPCFLRILAPAERL